MKMTFKKTFIFMTVLMLSAVSCSEVKQSESITSNSENTTVSSPSDEKGEIELTYAYYNELGNEFNKMVKTFNEEENGCKIVLKDYSDMLVYENPEFKAGITKESYAALKVEMYQDIIKGEIDIVDSSIIGEPSTFEILKNQGAFADLYQFMENDPDVNRSILNETVLKLNEIDGKLYNMPTYFGINTMIGETQYVGTKENWTFEDLKNCWEQMPEGATIGGHKTKEYVYMVLLRNMLHEFVDYKNGTASFDSPKFREMLQFCNDNFATLDYGWGSVPIDFNSPMLINDFPIHGIMKYYEYTKGENTLVGYPSNDGRGAFIEQDINYNFAINAGISAEKQECAWQFIRRFYDYDYQLDQYNPKFDDGKGGFFYQEEVGIPINNKAFEEGAKQIINGEIYSAVITQQGVEVNNGLPTQEDYEGLVEYIKTVNMVETRIHDDLWQIIQDEIYSYFAGGQDIDTTIDHIQNRASIMVSEKA